MWGLKAISRTLAFTLKEMESHWWVLNRHISRSDVSSHRIIDHYVENRLKGNKMKKQELGLRD